MDAHGFAEIQDVADLEFFAAGFIGYGKPEQLELREVGVLGNLRVYGAVGLVDFHAHLVVHHEVGDVARDERVVDVVLYGAGRSGGEQQEYCLLHFVSVLEIHDEREPGGEQVDVVVDAEVVGGAVVHLVGHLDGIGPVEAHQVDA